MRNFNLKSSVREKHGTNVRSKDSKNYTLEIIMQILIQKVVHTNF